MGYKQESERILPMSKQSDKGERKKITITERLAAFLVIVLFFLGLLIIFLGLLKIPILWLSMLLSGAYLVCISLFLMDLINKEQVKEGEG